MRILVFVLLVSVVAACANNDAVPTGIISKVKMETIVWQLIESDEYANILVNRDSLKKAGAEKMKIYQQVFDLNGVSMEEFKKSYLFYMDHPAISKVMFDSISARANRQHADVYNQKKDSIKPMAAPVPVSILPPGSGALLKRDSLLKTKLLRSKQRQDTIKLKTASPKKRLTKHRLSKVKLKE